MPLAWPRNLLETELPCRVRTPPDTPWLPCNRQAENVLEIRVSLSGDDRERWQYNSLCSVFQGPVMKALRIQRPCLCRAGVH